MNTQEQYTVKLLKKMESVFDASLRAAGEGDVSPDRLERESERTG